MRLWQTEAGSLQEFPFRCRFQSQAPSSSPYWIIAEAKIDLSRRRFFQHEVMNILLYLAASCSVLAVVFAFLAFFTARWRRENKGLLAGEIAQLIRSESDRIRAESAEQGRRMRQELAENLRGFQTATLQAFTELGRQLGGQIREFGEKLEAGLRSIDERASGIDARLDGGLERLSQRTTQSHQSLEETISGRLDDSAARANNAARTLREEVSFSVKSLQDSLVTAIGEQRSAAHDQFDAFARRLTESLAEMSAVLHRSLAEMAASGHARHHEIVQTLDEKTTRLSGATAEAARALRAELMANVQHLGTSLSDTLTGIGIHQKERLEQLAHALASLTESQIKTHEGLRAAVENRLDAIRTESANKLDEMRQTVDEKLQTTFEKRLGESFRIVSEQLERVYQGLGEMQSLAAGVGDLKRVLSNVKVRGIWGEIQLGSLLEQFLAPDQYVRNAQVREDSAERVEFAIRLPGHDSEHEVLLPIDAKFPQEDFDRLTLAAERGAPPGSKRLLRRSSSGSPAWRARSRKSTSILRTPLISPSYFCRPKASMPRFCVGPVPSSNCSVNIMSPSLVRPP
jgi:DNA recombination protein RmuC